MQHESHHRWPRFLSCYIGCVSGPVTCATGIVGRADRVRRAGTAVAKCPVGRDDLGNRASLAVRCPQPAVPMLAAVLGQALPPRASDLNAVRRARLLRVSV